MKAGSHCCELPLKTTKEEEEEEIQEVALGLAAAEKISSSTIRNWMAAQLTVEISDRSTLNVINRRFIQSCSQGFIYLVIYLQTLSTGSLPDGYLK